MKLKGININFFRLYKCFNEDNSDDIINIKIENMEIGCDKLFLSLNKILKNLIYNNKNAKINNSIEYIKDDNNNITITLNDVSEIGFDNFMRYLCGNYLYICDNNVVDILYISYILEEDELTCKCSEFIINGLNDKLFLDILKILYKLKDKPVLTDLLNAFKIYCYNYGMNFIIDDYYKKFKLNELLFIMDTCQIRIPNYAYLLDKMLDYYKIQIQDTNTLNMLLKYIDFAQINQNEISKENKEIIESNELEFDLVVLAEAKPRIEQTKINKCFLKSNTIINEGIYYFSSTEKKGYIYYIIIRIMNALKNNKLCDMSVKINGEKIESNKKILSLNPTFKQLIDDYKFNGELEIMDEITLNGYKSVERYISGNCVYFNPGNICDILFSSICYNEKILMKECEKYIIKTINPDISFNLLKIIPKIKYMRDLNKLCKCIENYIKNDGIKYIKNDLYKQFSTESVSFILSKCKIIIPNENYLLNKILEYIKEKNVDLCIYQYI